MLLHILMYHGQEVYAHIHQYTMNKQSDWKKAGDSCGTSDTCTCTCPVARNSYFYFLLQGRMLNFIYPYLAGAACRHG